MILVTRSDLMVLVLVEVLAQNQDQDQVGGVV